MAIDFTLDSTGLLGCIASAAAIGTTAYGVVDAVLKGAPPFWNSKAAPVGFKQIQTLIEDFNLKDALTRELGQNWEATLCHIITRDPENPEFLSLLSKLVAENSVSKGGVTNDQRSNLIITSALQASADRRKAAYRQAALFVSVFIGLAGALMILAVADSEGHKVTAEQFQAALLWFFLGCVGVPIAPVAKDLASALAGIASRQAVGTAIPNIRGE
jgi:hypothetical protein